MDTDYGTSGSASSSRRESLEAGEASGSGRSTKLLKSASSAESRDSQSLSQAVLIGGFGSFALVVERLKAKESAQPHQRTHSGSAQRRDAPDAQFARLGVACWQVAHAPHVG